jgi:putative flippase GtrA
VRTSGAVELSSSVVPVMTTTPRTTLRDHLRGSWRILLKELTAFGFVGAIALGIDLSIFAWLSHYGALKANLVSTTISTSFAYVGNRYWSFSHRARSSLRRETTFFFGINFIALGFSELVIALFVYPLHYAHSSSTVFAAKVATIGLGTIFRFWTYKRFVFLHPDRVHSPDADLDVELAE